MKPLALGIKHSSSCLLLWLDLRLRSRLAIVQRSAEEHDVRLRPMNGVMNPATRLLDTEVSPLHLEEGS